MFEEITPHSWACQMMLCQKTLQQSLPAFDEKSDVGSYRRKHHKTSCTYFFPGENDLPFSLRSRLTHRICLLANLQLVLSKQTSVVQAFKVMLLPQAKLLLLLQRIHTIICYEISCAHSIGRAYISCVYMLCTLQSDKKP